MVDNTSYYNSPLLCQDATAPNSSLVANTTSKVNFSPTAPHTVPFSTADCPTTWTSPLTLSEFTEHVRARVGLERDDAVSTRASRDSGGVIETVNSWSLPLPRSEEVLETVYPAFWSRKFRG